MNSGCNSSGKVVALVQARMGSRRLPGKMMRDLCGYPVLQWVLLRMQRCRRIDELVLATSGLACDDVLAGLAERFGVACFRGNADDVLGRFVGAAERHDARTVVRICADNPLVAPEELDRLIAFYGTAIDGGADPMRLYVFNHIPSVGSDYPDGLGGEMISQNLLHLLSNVAESAEHREHVFDYIWDHPEQFEIRPVPAVGGHGETGLRLDVDTKEDLAFLNQLCRSLTFESDVTAILRAARMMRPTIPG